VLEQHFNERLTAVVVLDDDKIGLVLEAMRLDIGV
jgi:hypothetical protein